MRAPAPARRPRVSPLRYPGGKAALYGRLREVIRRNGLAGCTYVEPYAGGAGSAVSLLVTGQVERIVLNDLDPAVYAFWRLLVDEPEHLQKLIGAAELSVDEWRRQKQTYGSADRDDYRKLGFATFYLNRTNRSGVLNGGPIGGHQQTGNYKIDARFNAPDLAERVRLIGLYRDNIEVTSVNGLKVIQKHARRRNTFIYADPPYFEKAGSLYMNNFAAQDHADLARQLNAVADSNWLLTYDNAPQLANLYSERRRQEFELSYSAREVRRATEVAVISDSLEALGDGWALRGENE